MTKTTKTVIKSITALFAGLLIAASAFAVPAVVPVATTPAFGLSLDSTYESHYVEQGVATAGAVVVSDVGVTFQSFSLGATTYAPVILSTNGSSINLGQVDLTGGYAFVSSLATLNAGYAFRHYNNPGKMGESDHSQFSLGATTKGLPLTVVARYDTATRSLNIEANVHVDITVNSIYTITPSAYLGYTDLANAFPHSLTEVKLDNRYVGGGFSVSRKLLDGTATLGGYVNRSAHAFSNTTFSYVAGYAVKL